MPKIIPLGNRLLVKRVKVGEKIGKEGLLYAPDQVSEHDTDLADVVYIPEKTFADNEILSNAEQIVGSLTAKACNGDTEALSSLLKLTDFIKLKSLKVGDRVFISKYVGTSFNTSDSAEELTLVKEDDILGMVVKDE